jgi:hypothetical protein
MSWIRIPMAVLVASLVAAAASAQAFAQVPLLDLGDQVEEAPVTVGPAKARASTRPTGSYTATVPGRGTNALQVGATDGDPNGLLTVSCLGAALTADESHYGILGLGDCAGSGGGGGGGDDDGGDDDGGGGPGEGGDGNGGGPNGGGVLDETAGGGSGDEGSGSGSGDGAGDGADCIAVEEAANVGGGSGGAPLWGSILLGLAMFGLGAMATRRRRGPVDTTL